MVADVIRFQTSTCSDLSSKSFPCSWDNIWPNCPHDCNLRNDVPIKNPLPRCCLRALYKLNLERSLQPAEWPARGYGPQGPPPQDVATSETLKRCQIISAQRPRRFKWSPGWINDWWKLVPVSSAILAAVELQPPPAVGFFGPAAGYSLSSRCEEIVRCSIPPLDEARAQKQTLLYISSPFILHFFFGWSTFEMS